MQIGIVIKIEDDPDKEDRIQIQLPTIDVQKGLGKGASLDAGKGRPFSGLKLMMKWSLVF
jgi:hypothetical protein